MAAEHEFFNAARKDAGRCRLWPSSPATATAGGPPDQRPLSLDTAEREARTRRCIAATEAKFESLAAPGADTRAGSDGQRAGAEQAGAERDDQHRDGGKPGAGRA